MPTILPIRPSIGAYRFTLPINDVQYAFRFKWNSRERAGVGAWYMDVFEFDGVTQILRGIKVVLGTYLGRWSTHPLLLNGVFVARSNAPVHEDATFDNFGASVQLLYFNRADLAAEMLGAFSEAT